jgi:hypothetical protein
MDIYHYHCLGFLEYFYTMICRTPQSSAPKTSFQNRCNSLDHLVCVQVMVDISENHIRQYVVGVNEQVILLSAIH